MWRIFAVPVHRSERQKIRHILDALRWRWQGRRQGGGGGGTETFENGNGPNTRGRRTPAGGGWTGANAAIKARQMEREAAEARAAEFEGIERDLRADGDVIERLRATHLGSRHWRRTRSVRDKC
ncbi:MAG TPA: hypothetical protein VMM77_00180 [Gemmatimonadaceae bacterium]|nr:hypothetical protein [Gemmatimonadaceae bacterium]